MNRLSFLVSVALAASFLAPARGVLAADGEAPLYLVEPLPAGRCIPAMPEPCYPVLKGQVVRHVFDRAVDLRRLVVYRGGLRTWAIPRRLEVSVNGGRPQEVALKATNLSSGPFKPKLGLPLPADSLVLDGAESVTSLVVKVTEIATTFNEHGILSLGLGRRVLDARELDAETTAGAGLALAFDAQHPVRDAELVLVTHECGEPWVWRYSPVDLPTGRSELRVAWTDFVCRDEPWRRLEGFHVDKMLLAGPVMANQALTLTVRADGKRTDRGVFARLPAVDGSPDASGWYRGIPSDGFGRFGWLAERNGLLSLNVDGDDLSPCVLNVAGCAFRYGSGQGLRTVWSRSSNNAHTLFTERLLREAGDIGERKSTRGYREFDLSREPERLVAGIQSPGVIVNSSDRVLSIDAAQDVGELELLMVRGGALVWTGGETVDLSGLTEGWIVLGAKSRPKTPFLIAFDRRPRRAVKDGNGYVFEFDEPRGWTGFAYPCGYRAWDGAVGACDGRTTQLAERSRILGGLLRNYPVSSEMRFKDEGDTILFEERPSFVRWENAWGEAGEVQVPCPPIVALAADLGYPVTFPDGLPQTVAADTKYGPYRCWPGGKTRVARYRLPKGEKDFTIYPCPAEDADARSFGAAIHSMLSTWTKSSTRHGQSAYNAWVRWDSSSMAQAFLTSAEHAVIATNWTDMINRIHDEHWWSVRREPIGGKEYPVSFAWLDGAEKILGDINSGIGAGLSAFDAYARFTGNWKLVEDNWELVRRMPLYFYYGHDWTLMVSGSREHKSTSGIDMDVIAYEGMAGLARMSSVLGKRDTGAFSEMVLARYALALFSRFHAPAWITPGLKHADWNGVGAGCGEDGFWVLRPGAFSQGELNGLVALNYSWGGTFQSFYAQMLKACGTEFWKQEEYGFVEKVVKDWRKNVPKRRNEHCDNIAAHLYWRLLLGESRESIARELAAQTNMARPNGHVASNCAGMYALYYGGESPVVLDEFAPARLTRFTWNKAESRVVAEFESGTAFTPRVRVRRPAKSAPATLRDLKPGRTVLIWDF